VTRSETGTAAIQRLTKARLLEGVDALSIVDRDLGRIAQRFGPPPLWGRRPGYATLVRIILEQQVSLASAKATYDRMRDAFGEVTPARISSLSAPDIQRAGVTRQKASYCLGLAQLIQSGDFDVGALGQVDDQEVRRRLVAIRGIGAWTADIYPLMALRRPDIWPDGDLALATAAQQVKRLRQRPDDARLRRLAARWAPWRAVGARLLWHYYLSTRGGRDPVAL
jgi:DNA-3-methyladenine glycosylase II